MFWKITCSAHSNVVLWLACLRAFHTAQAKVLMHPGSDRKSINPKPTYHKPSLILLLSCSHLALNTSPENSNQRGFRMRPARPKASASLVRVRAPPRGGGLGQIHLQPAREFLALRFVHRLVSCLTRDAGV